MAERSFCSLAPRPTAHLTAQQLSSAVDQWPSSSAGQFLRGTMPSINEMWSYLSAHRNAKLDEQSPKPTTPNPGDMIMICSEIVHEHEMAHFVELKRYKLLSVLIIYDYII